MKPLLVLQYPISLPLGEGGRELSIREAHELFENYLTKITKEEYHVLCFWRPRDEKEFKIEVFNSPNLTEQDIDELKAYIKEKLSEL